MPNSMRLSILGFVFFFIIFNYPLYGQSTSAKYDIGFVLRGFAGSNQFDSLNFEPYAREIVKRLNELSFEKVSTYKIFLAGTDERSPAYLQGLADIETLQASLDGWPGSKWDWLRARTDFWYVVPAEFRPIITNAINWIKSNKKSFGNWQKETTEGVANGDKIQNNVIRMGPSSAADYLKNMRLPAGYNANDFKTTFIILNSNSSESITGGGAQWTLQNFGVLKADGNSFSTEERNIALYVFANDQTMNGSPAFLYTVIHEGIHAFGMGTHDQDPKYLNKGYGVMSSFGDASSINTLPAWDRYFWNNWLPKSTITTKQSEVTDLKDKGKASDSTLKFILEVVAGDARGCNGTYKELYDGKWYSYKVDAWGTLTFIEGINNENDGAPKIIINPFAHKVVSGDKIVLRSIFTGAQAMDYVWKKNGTVLSGQKLNYLPFNKVQLSDSGSYTVTASNAFGSVTTQMAKLQVAPCAEIVSMKVSGQATGNICLNDSVQLSINVTSNVQWFKDGNAINNANASSYWVKNPGFYKAVISYANGCISDIEGVRINGKPEKPIFNQVKYTFCSADSLKLSITNVNKGDTIKWYFSNKLDLVYSSTKIIGDSIKLHVTRTDSLGCSMSSDTIQTIKYASPKNPDVNGSISYCLNASPSALSGTLSTGNSLLWYGTSVSGGSPSTSATIPSTSKVGTTDYYVSQKSQSTGCESQRSKISVKINQLPSKPIFNTSKFGFCSGDSLKLSITNLNKEDTIKWYFGTKSDLTNVNSKIFTDSTRLFVIKTDSLGCVISSDTIQIAKYAIPSPPTISRDTANNLVASFNGTTWYKDGMKISDTTQKFKPTTNGLYSATTTQNGCTSSISQSYYYLTSSLTNLSNGEYVKIYPNPTSGDIGIDYLLNTTKDLYITINDINGKPIVSNQKIRPGSKINLRGVISGIYIVLVNDKAGRLITTQKIVKE